jgi:hypothetical protein
LTSSQHQKILAGLEGQRLSKLISFFTFSRSLAEKNKNKKLATDQNIVL